jgi:hypothetical protein
MARRFVLVTAVDASVRGTRTASGIKKLKRGVTLREFATDFKTQIGAEELRERPSLSLETLRERPSWFTCSMSYEGHFLQWTFTEYQEDELFDAVAHLTKEELFRDLPELLPLR